MSVIIGLGHNPNSFSKAIGIIPQTTHKILKKRNKPGFDYLVAVLTKFPQIDARSFITGKGPLFISLKK